MKHEIAIAKIDEEQQLVYGEVYIPLVPDSHGDFMTAEDIEKMAHGFSKKGAVRAVDTEHNLKENGSEIVESFIARDGDPDFIEGAWVLSVHVTDPDVWALIKNGELNGFSMFGKGKTEERVLEIEIPDSGLVKGEVIETNDHTHAYAIKFDEQGNFLGGETGPGGGDKHKHQITRGTITDPSGQDDHVHKYSFLEALA